MKRFHVHVSVADLADSIRFYTALFAAAPAVRKTDYAKWMLEDPPLNFAIACRDRPSGVDHLGFQVESAKDHDALTEPLARADYAVASHPGAACCYARSDKSWVTDPTGIAWEIFHTRNRLATYGDDARTTEPDASAGTCCRAR